jgi:hypothetical protein
MTKFGWYKYSKALKRVVPIEEARAADAQLAAVNHGFIQDEMPATKHPLDGKYYTSKAKFRAATKALGGVEVGTAYENGYDPEKEQEREANKTLREAIHERFREHINNGVSADAIRAARELAGRIRH